MIRNHDLIDRFLRYVQIDTQSAEDSDTQPSTSKQHDLASLLYRELCEMGLDADYDRKHCYVYAKLPGEEPALGFISHMDTSPAASGSGVKPRIEENYQGHNILLFRGHGGAESIVMRPDDFPELLSHIGDPPRDPAPDDLCRLHAGRGDRQRRGPFRRQALWRQRSLYRRRQQTRRDRIRVLQCGSSADRHYRPKRPHGRCQKRDAQRCFGRNGVQ